MSLRELMDKHVDLNKELKELRDKIEWDMVQIGRLRSSCDSGYDEARLNELSKVLSRYMERCRKYADIALRMGELVLAMHKVDK